MALAAVPAKAAHAPRALVNSFPGHGVSQNAPTDPKRTGAYSGALERILFLKQGNEMGQVFSKAPLKCQHELRSTPLVDTAREPIFAHSNLHTWSKWPVPVGHAISSGGTADCGVKWYLDLESEKE